VQKSWQIQEAKNKLSEVVQEALDSGPQVLTRRGVEVAVVLSYPEYLKLKKKQTPLSEFFRRSPLAGVEDLNLDRDRSPARPGPEL
jgi:antitoxin Phd